MHQQLKSIALNNKEDKYANICHKQPETKVIFKTKHFEIMKADLNTSSSGNHTPLTYAIFKENVEIVEVLIKSGADVDQEDDDGWTPLVMAIDKGNHEITSLLIRNGANPNILDTKKRTPITEAIDKGNLKILKLLVENGANPNMVVEGLRSPLDKMQMAIFKVLNGANSNFVDTYHQGY